VELLEIFYFIFVGSCLNRHNFIHLNQLKTSNKLSCYSWDRLQAVCCAEHPQVQDFFIVCNADNSTVFFSFYPHIKFTVLWVLFTKWPKVYLKFCVICHCATKREVPLRFPLGSLQIFKYSSPSVRNRSFGVHSACNRNKYQGISLGVNCGRRVELTKKKLCLLICAEYHSQDESQTFPLLSVVMTCYGKALPFTLP
jgi:hypothetical protein